MSAITANGLYGDRARGLFGMAMPTGNGSATSSTSAQAVVEKTYSSIANLVKESATSNKEMIKLLSQQVRLLGEIKKTGGGLGLSDLLLTRFLGKLGGGIAAVGVGLGRAAAGVGGLVGGVTKAIRSSITSLFTNLKGNIIGGIGKMFTSVSTTITSVTKNIFSGGAGVASKMMGGIGDIAKFLPKAIGLIGKGISKLFWPITAAIGIFDSFKGAFKADEILGKKTSLTEKVLTGLASGINGLLMGIPDWLSNQVGFKNFAVLTDKIADSIKGVGTSIYDFVSTGVASLTSSISSGFSRLKDNLTKIGNWVGDILGTSPAEMEKKRKAGAAGANMGALMGREMQKNNNSSGPIDTKGLNVAQRMDKLEKELAAGSTTSTGAAAAPTTAAGAITTVAATAVATTRVATDAIKEVKEEAADSLADVKKKVEKKIDASFTDSIKKTLEGMTELMKSGVIGDAMKTLEADFAKSMSSMPGAMAYALSGGTSGSATSGAGGYSGRGGSSGGAGASSSYTGGRPATPAFTGGIASSSGIKDSAGRVVSTASTDMPAHQRAFLDTIAMGNATSGGNYWESPDYNTIVGGKKFENYGDHPRVFGTPNCTAAGRYQFTKTTWDDVVSRYNKANPNDNIKDFSPQNQDKAAYFLARADYARRTGGRNLDEDLRNNDPNIGNFIKQGLGGQGRNTTWEILQRKSGGDIQSAYAANLARNQEYTKGGKHFPAQGAQAGAVGGDLPKSVLDMRIKTSEGETKTVGQLGIKSYADLQTKGGQAFAGGYNDPNTTWLTSKIQENLGENFDRVTGQNDLYHPRRSPNSRHTSGVKTDFTVKGISEREGHSRTSEMLAQKYGMTEGKDFKMISKPHGTGKHIDFELTGEGRARVETIRSQEAQAMLASSTPESPTSTFKTNTDKLYQNAQGNYASNKLFSGQSLSEQSILGSRAATTQETKRENFLFNDRMDTSLNSRAGFVSDPTASTGKRAGSYAGNLGTHEQQVTRYEARAAAEREASSYGDVAPKGSTATPGFTNITDQTNFGSTASSSLLYNSGPMASQSMDASLTKTGDMTKEINRAVGKSIAEDIKAPQQPEFTPMMQSNGFQPGGGAAAGGGMMAAAPAPAPAPAPATSTRDVPSIDEMSMLMANSTMMS